MKNKSKINIKSLGKFSLLLLGSIIVIKIMAGFTSSKNELIVGDKVPDFTLIDDEGKSFHLYEELGDRNFVIYFYPKDDTPGCTKEACQFRDDFEDFIKLNTQVIGISSDNLESHVKFKEKYNLPFTLLSDEENSVRQLFGVKGNLFGVIPGRVSYIIDKNGVLHYIFNSQSNPKKHVSESMRILKEIQ